MKVCSNPISKFDLVQSSFGQTPKHNKLFLLGRNEIRSVLNQKRAHANQRVSLVSVNKGMVADYAERQGRGEVRDVRLCSVRM